MANNFWNVVCEHCGQSLRLTVKDENTGRKVEAICPKCKKKTLTTIGVPTVNKENTDLSPELKRKLETLREKLTEDPEINDLAREISEEGCDLFLIVTKYENNLQEKAHVVPKVDKDGNITADTFSKEDEEAFRRAFKITL